eukprot:594409_1
MSVQMTPQHKMVNRYLVTRGCASEQEMKACYQEIKNTYPGRIRTRNNKTELEQIIDDINLFMEFMNASVVTCDYEVNQTRYFAYQLAIHHDTNDDLITKHSINLPINQLKLFHKILDLSLMNNGLITRTAIRILNDALNQRYTSNNDRISDATLQELIRFVCDRRYLYQLPKDEDEKQNENTNNTNNSGNVLSYCLGPRSMVGLQIYIENKTQTIERLRNCPICFDVMIGYGFQCPIDNCSAGIYHAKCIESVKQSKKCANCQQSWDFDPTSRIGLLSDPARSENMIPALLDAEQKEKNKDDNHNHNHNNEAMSEDEEDQKDEDQVMIESQSQSQVNVNTRRRSNRRINDDESEDSD